VGSTQICTCFRASSNATPQPRRHGLAGKGGIVHPQAIFFHQAGIGGDVVRSWYAHKLHIPFGKAISSVIIDKLFGLIALTVVCLFGAGWFQLERIYFSVLFFLLIQLIEVFLNLLISEILP
jgi:hypothetical protein